MADRLDGSPVPNYFAGNRKFISFDIQTQASQTEKLRCLFRFINYCNSDASFCHNAAEASLGIRQSPRGESVTPPTLGPSGRQERLNC